jgi:hypothetical protein
MKYKVGDIVVILEDVKGSTVFLLKKGEICRVLKCYGASRHLNLQSLSPSYGSGNWICEIDNVALAPEIFQVLS